MSSLNELIINELQRTEVKDLSRLINYMKGERGFFWVRSGEHDHWTNGTAQHSWRVYQYMRHMWENPCEIPCNRKALNVPSYKADPALAPDKVKTLTENEIILTGLLHDVGKMWGCNHHASNSRKIIDSYLGEGFSEVYPKIVASIYFHHHKEKDGGFLNAYRNTTLRKLLNKADSMASGTTWHSIRFYCCPLKLRPSRARVCMHMQASKNKKLGWLLFEESALFGNFAATTQTSLPQHGQWYTFSRTADTKSATKLLQQAKNSSNQPRIGWREVCKDV